MAKTRPGQLRPHHAPRRAAGPRLFRQGASDARKSRRFFCYVLPVQNSDGEWTHENGKPALRAVYSDVYTGVADLYVYFYARALQLLWPGGMLAFISSNKWFRAGYGAPLRAHIADTTLVGSITDFNNLKVFQEADAYPMIFVAHNHARTPQTVALTRWTSVKSLDAPYPDVRQLIAQSGQLLPSEALSGSAWTLADAHTAKRLQTMRANGAPLGEYVNGQIFWGASALTFRHLHQ